MRHRGKHEPRRGRVLRTAYALGIAASLAALAYLNAIDLLAQWEAEANISRMSQVYEDADEPARREYAHQAALYNARLAGVDVGEEPLPYAKQLLYREEPMMSYLEIAKIALKLPIYHGTRENALMAGVGHWEASSLPVGGANTKCVLMGHSGMRNTRMFDDVRKLVPGDVAVLWTLGEPHAYRVSGTQTLEPDAAQACLAIEPGRDLLMLVTCTPIGVNSHRLIVRAERCAYVAEEAGEAGPAAYVNDRNLPLLAGALAALLVAIASIARRAQKGSARKRAAGQGGTHMEQLQAAPTMRQCSDDAT